MVAVSCLENNKQACDPSLRICAEGYLKWVKWGYLTMEACMNGILLLNLMRVAIYPIHVCTICTRDVFLLSQKRKAF